MTRETQNTDVNSIDDSFRAGLEHSFFRNIQDNITKENNFEPVYNFSLEDDEIKSVKREDFNDHNIKVDKFTGELLSSKLTPKEESKNFVQKLQSSNSHLFYSGYFGEKKEDVKAVDGNFSNFRNQNQPTNPFMFNESENIKKAFASARGNITSNQVELINIHTKVLNNSLGNSQHFNGSFLSASMSNSNLNRSNISKYPNSTNSFNDLVKSVSISNLSASKNKKSKTIFI
jgi:hypothetical protein